MSNPHGPQADRISRLIGISRAAAIAAIARGYIDPNDPQSIDHARRVIESHTGYYKRQHIHTSDVLAILQSAEGS